MANVDVNKMRRANFSSREKELLFSLVDKYKNIIQNKKTDAATNDKKVKTWAKVKSEFNAQNPVYRHRGLLSLKKKYYNKKQQELRKNVAEESNETILTGGGVAGPSNIKLEGESIVNEETIIRFNHPFDSDVVAEDLSSSIAEKNGILTNKRISIAALEEKKLQKELEAMDERAQHERRKRALELELLTLEIKIKKAQFQNIKK